MSSAQGIFSVCWLLLALLAAGGNLSSILYRPRPSVKRRQSAARVSASEGRKRMKQHG
jgi:hypothetical protein